MISCLIFVVAALVEFPIVVLISRSTTKMKSKTKDPLKKPNAGNNIEPSENVEPRRCWQEGENCQDVTGDEENNPVAEGAASTLARKLFAYLAPDINTIDLTAFCLYLFLFAFLNCIYWPAYLLRKVVYDY